MKYPTVLLLLAAAATAAPAAAPRGTPVISYFALHASKDGGRWHGKRNDDGGGSTVEREPEWERGLSERDLLTQQAENQLRCGGSRSIFLNGGHTGARARRCTGAQLCLQSAQKYIVYIPEILEPEASKDHGHVGWRQKNWYQDKLWRGRYWVSAARIRTSYGAETTHRFGGVELCNGCKDKWRDFLESFPERAAQAFPEIVDVYNRAITSTSDTGLANTFRGAPVVVAAQWIERLSRHRNRQQFFSDQSTRTIADAELDGRKGFVDLIQKPLDNSMARARPLYGPP
ncbi:hypothetical protein DFH09DRAFT_1105411 [Mycena vulgaris]|nr:hypothetical protein DFH09DRAFT_1105411 [Mycena vulgaris]